MKKRTDLAAEAKEMWSESAGRTDKLSGVRAETRVENGYNVEEVRVLDLQGERAIGKPIGTYISVEISPLAEREDGAFARGASVIAAGLRSLLNIGEGDGVLVCGLGNSSITPDNIGPGAVKNTLATRHLIRALPEQFKGFRPVAVIEPGVLGTTGIESAEVVKAVAERVKPSAVIAVDALASRRMERICRTVQLADTGIVPGSGVGNSRGEISRKTLGVPVVAIGVPTVVDAATLAADIMERAGLSGHISDEELEKLGGGMIVTPREIDSLAAEVSKLIGYGINLALQDCLTVEDISMLL